MPTISGRIAFDSARTGTYSPLYPPIPNVPIVLQDTTTGEALAVLSNSNGEYVFNNVPQGSYQIVEQYGFTPAAASPGDFTAASGFEIISGGITPPISYVTNPPIGANHIDCLLPNTILVTVDTDDIENRNFLNGPVRYSPISIILDSHATIISENLLSIADFGTFGTLSPGTASDTYAPTNPYPGIGSGFNYVQSNLPRDGQFTIGNIANIGMPDSTWWHYADHTTGNETGRMMTINGSNPGAEIYKEIVDVKPNTYYLFSTWILNMIKVAGLANPALGISILDGEGRVLYQQTLGQFIPANLNTPEWVQAGTTLYSDSNSQLTVMFLSEGPAQIGNDYVIDDISLYEINIPVLVPVKSADKTTASTGDTVVYTVTLTNIFDREITDVRFQDTVPSGLSFIPGSVRINNVPFPSYNPNSGFEVQNVAGGETVTIRFSAEVTSIPAVNPTINNATMSYNYDIVDGGIVETNEIISNPVDVLLDIYADIAVTKVSDKVSVKGGSEIIYTLKVTNNGPARARNVIVTDIAPKQLTNVLASTDSGLTFIPWNGSIEFAEMANGTSHTILIKGTVNNGILTAFTNTATAVSVTPDPDLANNTATISVGITSPRCQAITDIIESIALEETALARILDAEGAKIQAMLSIENVSASELLELNNKAAQLVESISRLELILQTKLETLSRECE